MPKAKRKLALFEQLMAEASAILSKAQAFATMEMGQTAQPFMDIGRVPAKADHAIARREWGVSGGSGVSHERRVLLRESRRPDPSRQPVPPFPTPAECRGGRSPVCSGPQRAHLISEIR